MADIFEDAAVHHFFKWHTDHPKLAKAIKVKMGELMREAHSLHKTAVRWHDTQFVDQGVIISFKKPSTHKTTYAWAYRALVPLIMHMGFSKDDWQWAAVVCIEWASLISSPIFTLIALARFGWSMCHLAK